MARTKQTVNVYKLTNVSLEELATWTPAARKWYWKGVFDRRRAAKAQAKVAIEQKILSGIFASKNILQNRRLQSIKNPV